MSEARCHWVSEPGVGRVLIPGCMNRAIYGDDAICHCRPAQRDRVSILEDRVADLAAELAQLKKSAA